MKYHDLIKSLLLGLILVHGAAYGAAGVGPHNKSNMVDYAFIDFPDGSSTSTSNCSNCHYNDYVSRCETCHTNDTGGGYSDMSTWDNQHDYVTDSAPAVMTHKNLACGDCHWAVTHTSMAGYYNNKLVSGTFSSTTVSNTLLGTHTWNPDPAVWTDSNGDPGIGRLEEQWASTITIPSGYTVEHPHWNDPAQWMEKTGPERGLILAVINASGGFDNENGTFEIISTVVNADDSVTLTFKGKLVLSSLYQVDQNTPAFALYYHQMMKYAIGYCDDPNQPGLQINTADPQICFQDMGENPWTATSGYPYGSSNCPQDVECIHQDVFFAGPSDFAKTDNLADIDGDGTFSDDTTPNGICQVCHLGTKFWRRDGSRTNHNSGADCIDCHEHTTGFQPSCNSCHGYPPSVGINDRHNRHSQLGYGCQTCHYETTADGSNRGPAHNNGTVNVGPGPGATFAGRPADGAQSLSFIFTPAPGGGTCSSNTCHAYWSFSDPIRWEQNIEVKVIPYPSALSSVDTDRTVSFNATRSACYETVNGINEDRTCTYDWDFGGAGHIVGGNNDNQVYEYDTAGQYTVTLTMTESVTNKQAVKTLTARALEVEPAALTGNFTTTVNGSTVTLQASGLSPEIIHAYVFWGDRTRGDSNDPPADLANGMAHTYTRGATTYNISVITYDTGRRSSTYTFNEDSDLTITIP